MNGAEERDVEILAYALDLIDKTPRTNTYRAQAKALLASDWLAGVIAAAEQRGREDNADHGMCYVHGSEALAALVAAAKADERERIAQAIEASAWCKCTDAYCTQRATIAAAARIARTEPS